MTEAVRILLIDDNPDDRLLAKRELTAALGAIAAVEPIDADGFRAALAGPPADLVVSDLKARWIGGAGVLEAAKARWPGVPVIIFTGTGSEEGAADSFRKGLDDYVIKSRGGYKRLGNAAAILLKRARDAAAREAAERRYRAMFESSPVGMIETGIDGRILAANPAARRMFGFGAEEDMGGFSLDQRYADPAEGARIFAEQLRDGEAKTVEVRRRRRDGSVFWAEMRLSAELDADGRPRLLHSAVVDITDRKLREEQEAKVRAVEASYRKLVDDVPVGIVEATTDGRVLTANPAWRRMFGLGETEDLGGFNTVSLWPDPQERADFMNRLQSRGGIVQTEMRARRRDGSRFWVQFRANAIVGPDGKLERLRGVNLDITDRKLREEQEAALRAVETDYRRLVDEVPVGILETTSDGRILGANPAWRALYGFEPDADLGTSNTRDLWAAPPLREELVDELRRSERPIKAEIKVRRRDGTEFWVEIHANAIRNPGGELQRLRGVHLDISDRKRRQEQEAVARALEANYGALVAASAAPIVALDNAGNVTVWNPAAERLFGYAASEVLGKPPPTIPDDQRAEFERGLAVVLAGSLLESPQRTRRTRDGRIITVAVRAAPIVGSDGKPAGSIAVVTDLTERLALEEQLRQAQKMEAIGQLAGGIAHDFNNLLTVVLGGAETLKEALAGNPDLRRVAELIGAAAQRGAELTGSMLAFSRRQPLEPRITDINALVARMRDLLSHAIGERIEIRLDCAEGLWTTAVDPGQLETALLNLAVNARDAMPRGGTLVIQTANVELDLDYARRNVDVAPGPYVMLAVSDTGEGMPPEVAARAFEPFFTTKDVGKGTGLGLSMVHGFVRQSRGHVKIYSERGHGTAVKVYLPRATADELPADASLPPIEGRGRGETILVVEDNDLMRAHVESLLAGLGYRVVTAGDGNEALAVLGRADPVDLLFTDMVMPGGISGRQLATEALRLRPALKVLLTSGYPKEMMDAQRDPGLAFDLLSKPYQRHQLAEKLRGLLDAAH